MKHRRKFIEHLGLNSWYSALVGVIVGACLLFFTPGNTVPSWLLGVCIISALFIIWLLILKILSLENMHEISHLSIIRFYSAKGSIKCLTHPCEYLNYGAYVTLFIQTGELESYIGTGIVDNIQSDKHINITLQSIEPEYDAENLLLNNVDILNSIIIKPIVTQEYIKNL